MITIHVTPDDLVKLRFAYRPLLEIPLSYRVWINQGFQSPYRHWVEEAHHVLYDADLPYLSALVTSHGYIPDFLTPTPVANRVDIEADFEELMMIPDSVIQEGIFTLIQEDGDSEMRRFFLVHPRAALGCLIEEMRVYWHRTLAHYWSRMTATLESDVLYRARQLALDGPSSVFGELHSTIDFYNNQIQLHPVCQHLHDDVDLVLNGTGIQLVPVIFRGCGRMFQVAPGWQPMLAYGVRGAGLWYQKAPPSNQSLEHALGVGRARVLQVLRMPISNAEVAHKARISTATASQHLMRLKKAGLVQHQRHGKRVYYSLTERGENLLNLFETTD